jgi:hypothetical protein
MDASEDPGIEDTFKQTGREGMDWINLAHNKDMLL